MKKLIITVIFLVLSVYFANAQNFDEFNVKDSSENNLGLSISFDKTISSKFNEMFFGIGLRLQFSNVNLYYNFYIGKEMSEFESIFKTSLGFYAASYFIRSANQANENYDTDLAYFNYAVATVLLFIPKMITVNFKLNENVGIELFADLFTIEYHPNQNLAYLGLGIGFPIEFSKGVILTPFVGAKKFVNNRDAGIYMGFSLDLMSTPK